MKKERLELVWAYQNTQIFKNLDEPDAQSAFKIIVDSKEPKDWALHISPNGHLLMFFFRR